MLRRTLLILIALVAAAGLAVMLYAFREAREAPVVKRATLMLDDWPAGAKPVKAVLLSDIHIGDAAVDESRLHRIVDQVNALHPDIVFLAGDFIYGDDPDEVQRVAAPLTHELARLHAPLGTVAVLGNHDVQTDPFHVIRILKTAGVIVLQNDAVQLGPLAVAGIGDVYTKIDNVDRALARLAPLQGARIFMTHSPAIMWKMPKEAKVVLTAHTHCGQIVLPGIVHPGARIMHYFCGLYREPDRTVLVTGGVGTSNLPLRFGAPPDMWLLTLGGKSSTLSARSPE